MIIRLIKYAAIVIGLIIIVGILGLVVTQRVSDGPIEFLQGGSFKTGELVEEPVLDWSFGVDKTVEFELVGFGSSRTAGYIMHEGIAYMTCDLGFMWSRFEGQQKTVLNLIYFFKRWHKDALEDGRALLRIEDKLYKANFVRVYDPDLNEILKTKLEDLGREYLAPDELGPRPVNAPNDVWFFRMDT